MPHECRHLLHGEHPRDFTPSESQTHDTNRHETSRASIEKLFLQKYSLFHEACLPPKEVHMCKSKRRNCSPDQPIIGAARKPTFRGAVFSAVIRSKRPFLARNIGTSPLFALVWCPTKVRIFCRFILIQIGGIVIGFNTVRSEKVSSAISCN